MSIKLCGKVDKINKLSKYGNSWASIRWNIDKPSSAALSKEGVRPYGYGNSLINASGYYNGVNKNELIDQDKKAAKDRIKFDLFVDYDDIDKANLYHSVNIVSIRMHFDASLVLDKDLLFKSTFLREIHFPQAVIDDLNEDEIDGLITDLFDDKNKFINEIVQFKGIGSVVAANIYKAFSIADMNELYDNVIDRTNTLKLIKAVEKLNLGYTVPYGTAKILMNYCKSKAKPKEATKQLLKLISDNIFSLTKIKGIGFHKVDDIYLSNENNSLFDTNRIQAKINYEYNKFCDNNNRDFIYASNLSSLMTEAKLSKEENSRLLTKYKQVLKDMCTDNKYALLLPKNGQMRLIAHDKLQFEKNLFTELKMLSEIKDPSYEVKDEFIEQGISEAEAEQGFKFTDEQRSVIEDVLKHNVSTINGFAGTGKSSILRAIDKIIKLNYEDDESYVIQCAFTGRAANSLSKSSGFLAKTAHATLRIMGDDDLNEMVELYSKDNLIKATEESKKPMTEEDLFVQSDSDDYDPFDENNQKNLLDILDAKINASLGGVLVPGKTIIIDEYATLNVHIFALLLHLAVNHHLRMILIGDSGQLPAIEVSTDKIINDSQFVAHHNLSQVKRQDDESEIFKDSLIIRHGQIPDHFYAKKDNPKLKEHDLKYHIYDLRKGATFTKDAEDIFFKYLNSGVNVNDIVILTATNRLNAKLNTDIHKRISKDKISSGADSFRIGNQELGIVNVYEGELIINNKNQYDKVVRIGGRENTMSIYNGSIGKVIKIYHSRADKKLKMRVDFGLLGVAEFSEGDPFSSNLALSYAITIHKSQGSTIKHVIPLLINTDQSAVRLNSKQLLYTAITRASDTCDVIISEEVFKETIRKNAQQVKDSCYDLLNGIIDVNATMPEGALKINEVN